MRGALRRLSWHKYGHQQGDYQKSEKQRLVHTAVFKRYAGNGYSAGGDAAGCRREAGKERLEQASGAEEAAEPETAETEVPETVYQHAGGREPEDDIQDTAEEFSAAAEDPSGADAFPADSLPEAADAYPEEDTLLPEDGAPVIEPFVNKNVEKF